MKFGIQAAKAKVTEPIKSAVTIAWLALSVAMLALCISLGGAFRAR